MFKNEEYSSFLLSLLIYKFYIPISTFRVSYKATTVTLPVTLPCDVIYRHPLVSRVEI